MRKFILGSDWWDDCDDVIAVRLLCNLHRKKELELLGVCLDACMEYSVPSLDAFLRYSGLENIPIGTDPEANDFGGVPSYQKRLAELPSRCRENKDAENGVKFYRRHLAASPDKLEVLEIGYPQVLAALLESESDEYSPLNGQELVRQKVAHLWIMAGKWDEEGGRENNFCRNRRASAAAAKVCADWPVPVTFLGWEVGDPVISGSHLPESDPLKQAMMDHGSGQGRNSWDPMLILLAAAGDPEKAGYRCVYGNASVNPENGANYFEQNPSGSHRYVVKQKPDAWYAQEIDSLLACIL